jgi:hypothetical protein
VEVITIRRIYLWNEHDEIDNKIAKLSRISIKKVLFVYVKYSIATIIRFESDFQIHFFRSSAHQVSISHSKVSRNAEHNNLLRKRSSQVVFSQHPRIRVLVSISARSYTYTIQFTVKLMGLEQLSSIKVILELSSERQLFRASDSIIH